MILLTPDRLNVALKLLGEELSAQREARIDLVVCGGAAILNQQFLTRTTKDVDILCRIDDAGQLIKPDPLPQSLRVAGQAVARSLGLAPDWLNTGPSDQLKTGLPHGFKQRLVTQDFGPSLRIYFVGRFDLIHLKLFAALDQGPGRHVDDLRALSPTDDEILSAAKWVATQDAGPQFPDLLRTMLEQIGYGQVIARL